MRERLIELLKSKPYGYSSYEDFADYLLAEGVIVPPCKIGDYVYIVEHPFTFMLLKKVVEGEVVSIHFHEHGLFLRVLFDTKKINGCVDYNLNLKLGKTVFLSKEEAEQALAEREGKG